MANERPLHKMRLAVAALTLTGGASTEAEAESARRGRDDGHTPGATSTRGALADGRRWSWSPTCSARAMQAVAGAEHGGRGCWALSGPGVRGRGRGGRPHRAHRARAALGGPRQGGSLDCAGARLRRGRAGDGGIHGGEDRGRADGARGAGDGAGQGAGAGGDGRACEAPGAGTAAPGSNGVTARGGAVGAGEAARGAAAGIGTGGAGAASEQPERLAERARATRSGAGFHAGGGRHPPEAGAGASGGVPARPRQEPQQPGHDGRALSGNARRRWLPRRRRSNSTARWRRRGRKRSCPTSPRASTTWASGRATSGNARRRWLPRRRPSTSAASWRRRGRKRSCPTSPDEPQLNLGIWQSALGQRDAALASTQERPSTSAASWRRRGRRAFLLRPRREPQQPGHPAERARATRGGAGFHPGGRRHPPQAGGSAVGGVPARPRQEPPQPGQDLAERELGQHEEALALAEEALDALWPLFVRLPAAFAVDAGNYLDAVRTHLAALCRPPTPALLQRIEAFDAARGNSGPAPP